MIDFSLALWLGWTLKSSLVLFLVLLWLRQKKASDPAIRFAWLFCGLSAFLVFPIIEAVLPGLWVIWVEPVSIIGTGELKDQVLQLADASRSGNAAFSIPPTPWYQNIRMWQIIWILGMMWGSSRFIGRLVKVWLLAKRAEPLKHKKIAKQASKVAQRLKLKKTIPIKISSQIQMPQAWGPPAAFILLPEEALHWSESRLEVVLSHEMAHCQRWDALTSCFIEAVCIVQWFNPLVKLAAKQAAFEQELAADARALATGIHRCDYSGELVGLAKSLRSPSTQLAATMTLLGQKGLRERVAFLLNSKRRVPDKVQQRMMWLGSVCVLTLGSLFGQVGALSPPRPEMELEKTKESFDPLIHTLLQVFKPNLEESRKSITDLPQNFLSPVMAIPEKFSFPKRDSSENEVSADKASQEAKSEVLGHGNTNQSKTAVTKIILQGDTEKEVLPEKSQAKDNNQPLPKRRANLEPPVLEKLENHPKNQVEDSEKSTVIRKVIRYVKRKKTNA